MSEKNDNYSRKITKDENGHDVIETKVASELGWTYSRISADGITLSNQSSNSIVVKQRGFEVVSDEHRKHMGIINLPIRADLRSAGYDFYLPVDIVIPAGEKVSIFSDVKSYMQPNEYLALVPRSSAGVKLDIMFSNTIGIIDSSYYENPDNDGNIGFSFRNMGDKDVVLKKGERIGQGIFMRYLLADNDEVLALDRIGGYGSSGR